MAPGSQQILKANALILTIFFYSIGADLARRRRPNPARAQDAHVQQGRLLAGLSGAEVRQQGVDAGVLVSEEREFADQAVLRPLVEGLVL